MFKLLFVKKTKQDLKELQKTKKGGKKYTGTEKIPTSPPVETGKKNTLLKERRKTK